VLARSKGHCSALCISYSSGGDVHFKMPWSEYQKVKEIGSGSFGRAYLVTCARPADKEKKLLVMKEIDLSRMNSNEKKATEVEVRVLASLKHPYIVRYSESFVHDQSLCIVMDYCEGGDLQQYINQRRRARSTIPELQVVRWFTQMSLGLKHMHDKNILHRDIKTQNIFLAKKESRSEGGTLSCVKIADFGISKVLDSQTALARTQVGTPYYLSPEICQKQPYATPSDIWALGCVVFELCAMKVPFEAQDLPQLVDKIVRGTIPRIPSIYSRELGDIVGELLSRQAPKRPSAETVLQKPMLQAEIKRMIEENKRSGKGENDQEEPRRGQEARRDSSSREPNTPQPRGVLQERNHSLDHRERRAYSKGAPTSRAPSPHKEVAKQIAGPNSRAPSPRHRDYENRPHSARVDYVPSSARQEYIPHSARGYHHPQTERRISLGR